MKLNLCFRYIFKRQKPFRRWTEQSDRLRLLLLLLLLMLLLLLRLRRDRIRTGAPGEGRHSRGQEGQYDVCRCGHRTQRCEIFHLFHFAVLFQPWRPSIQWFLLRFRLFLGFFCISLYHHKENKLKNNDIKISWLLRLNPYLNGSVCMQLWKC